MNTISMRSRRLAIVATATLEVASALTGCAEDDSEDIIPVSAPSQPPARALRRWPTNWHCPE